MIRCIAFGRYGPAPLDAAATRGARCHTNITPLERHRLAVSASARLTRSGDTSAAAIETLTIIGGMVAVVLAAGAAANAVDATSANTAVVAISIMPAIDGCNRRKFDVRNREDR